MADKIAEITETDDGLVRITLSDPEGDMETLRVTLPPGSAYQLGEALCLKAINIMRRPDSDES
jgi:hypothetical protein